ncbi:MAG TPA: ABC transporter substrate-binding protein [Candidatus Nanopelagicaceae bacterium]
MHVLAAQTKNRRTLIFRSLIAIATTALLVSGTAAQAAPSPKAGAACSKAKAAVTVKSGKAVVKLICTKLKGHLIWVAAPSPIKKPVVVTAKLGGNFRVGVVALPTGKGNPFVGIGTPSIYTMSAIYDSLVTVNEVGDLVPSLATKWTQTSDTSWTFTLRDGVSFSNGEKFDANSVVATINYLTQDPVGAKTVVAAEINTISSVSGSGNTVTINTKTADSVLPRKLSVVWMVAPKAWETLGAAGYALNPVGTGPFAVSTWGATALTLQANKASWRSPKVDSMQILQIPDPTARIQAMQSGQIDLAVQVGPDEVSQIDPKKFQVVYDSFPQVMSLAYITTKGDSPLLNKQVRLALNYAVNRDAIVKNLLGGKGTAANQGSTKAVFGYDANLPKYPYDPTQAKALLAQAGYPTGFTISADVTVGSFPADADIYQAVAHDLKRIGVTLLLRQVPFSEWLAEYSTNGWTGQAFGLSWNSNTLDAGRAIGLFSCSGPGKFFCNQEMTPVLTEINSATTESARKAALLKAAQINYYNPPALYIVGQVDINVLGSMVKGFKNVNRYFEYQKITVR